MSVRPEGSTEACPEAWAFGATPQVADELLALVLAGAKTATAGALWDYEVDAEHAWLEGEGDRSLDTWRSVHETFFTDYASHDRGFVPDMPVVLERFELMHPSDGALVTRMDGHLPS